MTNYVGLCGGLEITQTAETNAQVTVNSAFTFSQLLANIISNSISSASTLTLRANAGNTGSVAVSIGANSTADTYTAATTDAMNYKFTTGTTDLNCSLKYVLSSCLWTKIRYADTNFHTVIGILYKMLYIFAASRLHVPEDNISLGLIGLLSLPVFRSRHYFP